VHRVRPSSSFTAVQVHLHRALRAGGDAARGLAGQLPHLALELAHPRLAGVLGDHGAQRLVGHLQLLGAQPRVLPLPRKEEALGDGLLLLLRVAAELHRLHAVVQRRRDVLGVVGRRDEEHLAQVERHAQVVVRELVVLRGVQHLQQRAGRIALVADAQLVHLVQQDHRVAALGLLQRLHDAPRHGAHVGAPVPADVRLVAHAAQRDAHVLAPSARAIDLAIDVLPTPGGRRRG
jgi:hypothetical protein